MFSVDAQVIATVVPAIAGLLGLQLAAGVFWIGTVSGGKVEKRPAAIFFLAYLLIWLLGAYIVAQGIYSLTLFSSGIPLINYPLLLVWIWLGLFVIFGAVLIGWGMLLSMR